MATIDINNPETESLPMYSGASTTEEFDVSAALGLVKEKQAKEQAREEAIEATLAQARAENEARLAAFSAFRALFSEEA